MAQGLEAAHHDDEALGSAWRDGMQFRHATFRTMVETLRERAEVWTIDDAA